MIWTKDIPKCPGFYWYRPGGDATRDHVVKIYNEPDLNFKTCLYVQGIAGGYRPVNRMQQAGADPDLWSSTPIEKPFTAHWHCISCDMDVDPVLMRCGCKTSPSPWAPIV